MSDSVTDYDRYEDLTTDEREAAYKHADDVHTSTINGTGKGRPADEVIADLKAIFRGLSCTRQ